LDHSMLLARFRSVIYLPNEGPLHDQRCREMMALFDRFAVNGKVRMAYEVIAFTAGRLE
jgi:hypothetical protein